MKIIDERWHFDDCEAFGASPIDPPAHLKALGWYLPILLAVLLLIHFAAGSAS